jgi:hypothetical protein
MTCDFSWQIASIWLGGLAFAAFLTSWWLRLFWINCLVITAFHLPPVYNEYMALLMIAIGLSAVEGCARIDAGKLTKGMCVAALFLIYWMVAQRIGLVSSPFGGISTGPFNPTAGGVFLALCMPGCLHQRLYIMIPVIFYGIIESNSLTGMVTAVASVAVYMFVHYRWHEKFTLRMVSAALGALLALIISFSIIKTPGNLADNPRWLAWKHAAWSLRSEMWGRGLNSWELIFPLLASGEPRLGTVTNENGRIVMKGIFDTAHNEYVQAPFEMGIQSLALIGIFVLLAGIFILTCQVPAYLASGMTALIVGSFGWHVFHVAPLAFVGCVWLGMWQRNRQNKGIFERTAVLSSTEPYREGNRRFWAI